MEGCSGVPGDTPRQGQQRGRRLWYNLDKEQMEAGGLLPGRHGGHRLPSGCSWQPCRGPHGVRLPGTGDAKALLHSSCSSEVSLPATMVATPTMPHPSGSHASARAGSLLAASLTWGGPQVCCTYSTAGSGCRSIVAQDHLQQPQNVAAEAAPRPPAQAVQQQEALQGVALLSWPPDAVQQLVGVLGAVQVMPVGPVVARPADVGEQLGAVKQAA